MDAFCDGAIKPLHLGRRFESTRGRLGALAGSGLRFICARTGVARRLLRSIISGLLGCQLFGDLSLQFVQLRIAGTDEVQVPALECAELSAQVGCAQFALGQFRFEGGLLEHLASELALFWFDRRSVG